MHAEISHPIKMSTCNFRKVSGHISSDDTSQSSLSLGGKEDEKTGEDADWGT